MGYNWRTELKRIIDDTPGLSMKGVSLKAGLSESFVRDVINRGADPSAENLAAICSVIGITPYDLQSGSEPVKRVIPVVGIVSAGEGWTNVDDGTDTVEFELGPHDSIAIEVRGDSMVPVYRSGDTLICHRQFGPHADNLIGLDCVVRTADGRNFVKILRRGTRPGRFNLRSYNSAVDDIEDVALAWVAPVAWIKRGRR
jgi:phage repressor protein C with HTH and peptisase S24 domain